MRSVRIVVGAVALATICELGLRAQSADTLARSDRLERLEEAVRALEKQVAELVTLVRAAGPPSPIEDITPFALTIAGAAIKGSTDAKVALVEFSDFQCPFCARHAEGAFPELQRRYVDTGRIKYVFRNLPLEEMHPHAVKAAEAAECAGEQGQYWEMHRLLFSNQKALGLSDLLGHADALKIDQAAFRSCLVDGRMTAKVRADLAEAQRLGLTGTPTFLIGQMSADGTVGVTAKIAGAHPFPVFQAALERLMLNPTALTTK